MPYHLVLFDFDGTLADSFPWFLKATNQLADKHGFKRIAPHEVDTLRDLSSRDLMAHLGLPLWKLPAVTSDMRRLMTENVAEIPLFDGVRTMLERLSAGGITLGVVTSNTEANVRSILGDSHVRLIRHFACGASMFGKKAKFRKVMKAAGIAPGHVLCVGDEIRDAQAASEAGLGFAAVGWGYTNANALATYSCAAPFSHAGELTEWLIQQRES